MQIGIAIDLGDSVRERVEYRPAREPVAELLKDWREGLERIDVVARLQEAERYIALVCSDVDGSAGGQAGIQMRQQRDLWVDETVTRRLNYSRCPFGLRNVFSETVKRLEELTASF